MKPAAGAPAAVLTGIGLVCPQISSRHSLVGLGLAPSGADREEPWFDPARFLGPRGWKYHSPASRFLLAAAGLALAESGLDPAALPPESTGVVIGTNFAATPVVARFDRTVLAHGSDALSPAEAPSFSVNIPASQVSVRYAIRGFNLTLTNPMVAGLEAILTLGSAVRAGKIAAGVAGAAEERPEDIPGDAAGTAPHRDPGEGACCLVLESKATARARGAVVLAELTGGFSRFLPSSPAGEPSPDVLAAALGGPLRALIEGHDEGPLPLVTVGPSGDGGWLASYCADTCAGAGVPVTVHGYPGKLGTYFTVSALLQLAGLVTEYGRGLVVCAGPHGNVAAVLLRARRGEEEPR